MTPRNYGDRVEELEFFFDQSLDLLCVAGFDGYFKVLNPAWEATLGFSIQELLSTPFVDFVHPDDRGSTLAEAAKLPQGQLTYNFDNRYRCKDGSYRSLQWKAAPSVGRQRIYAIARDVTESKRVENTLRQDHQRLEARVDQWTNELRTANQTLQSLIDFSPQAIIALDTNHHVRLWNRGAEKIFGYPAQEVLGKPFPYAPEGKRTEYDALMHRVEQNEPIANVEIRHQKRDGSRIDILISVVETRDSSGTMSGHLVIATDVTERKRLEAQLYRAQRLESIGMLASGIAHDLNNVLAPILMGLQLMRSQFTDQSSQLTLTAIESSAKRGANLVKQILTFTRGLEGERMRVQARHVLRDVEKIITRTFPKSIEILLDIPRDLFTVSADATQLHQVFMNLCINSRDAMPNGGVLTVAAQNVMIDEYYAAMYPEAQPGPYITIEVSDTGTGIPKEIIGDIFEPFFTTKAVGKGTGLGLSTVHAIVKSHGGFVTLNSEPGKGTAFKVHLPALETSHTSEARAARPKLPSGSGELILVVDDEGAIRDITRITLESYGYRVLTAGHGAEGVALYAKHADDIKLVISDMNMPIMDGAAMTKAVQAINRDVKVLTTSGLSPDLDIGLRADQAGASAFLIKPYTAEQLLLKINELLKT